MDIFYIENFKVPDRLEVKAQKTYGVYEDSSDPDKPSKDLPFELRTICFVKTTPLEFMATLGLDELYTTEVKLVSDVVPIYYDTTTKTFYRYFTSFKKEEFAKKAITITLENGHVMKKIDWKPNFLSPKMLIGALMRKFVKDMMKHDFQELYN